MRVALLSIPLKASEIIEYDYCGRMAAPRLGTYFWPTVEAALMVLYLLLVCWLVNPEYSESNLQIVVYPDWDIWLIIILIE